MGRLRSALALLVLASLVAVVAAIAGKPAQQPQSPASPSPPAQAGPVANPDDVRSMDSIVAALYDVISGPASQHRNWDRLRSLFVPGARLSVVGHARNGDITVHHFSVEEYISRATPIFDREGFYEREIARHTDTYNHMTQLFSTYESRHAQNEKPFQRGINSMQLLNDGRRWWVVSIFWEAETPGQPIPKKYRRPAGKS